VERTTFPLPLVPGLTFRDQPGVLDLTDYYDVKPKMQGCDSVIYTISAAQLSQLESKAEAIGENLMLLEMQLSYVTTRLCLLGLKLVRQNYL